jgi:2-C-methyl-D-erythritol 4-phosphate cytidylyltransferase
MIAAVIVAGGSGHRMGGDTRKQYLGLRGKPVLRWTLEAVAAPGVIDDVVLVVPQGDVGVCRRLVIDPWGEAGAVRLVAGGAERQASVYNGVRACPPGTRIVVVHDGVRPFVTPEILRACIEGARRWGGAIAGVAAVDTLKRVDDQGRILATVDRSPVRLAQTPQAFRFDLLRKAHEAALADGFAGTDDAQLVERIGGEVRVVAGSSRNVKLTRPDDLILAEAFLARGADEGPV